MENNIIDDNFYKQLTEDEKQLCDLCRDWNLGECEKCEKEEEIVDCKEKRWA